MRRSNLDYSQSVIGDCGHVCAIWPQITKVGEVPEVICDDCTRDQYGIGTDESISVWVRVREPVAKKAAPKKAVKPRAKTPRCSLCQQKGHVYSACPLIQEGMFDG